MTEFKVGDKILCVDGVRKGEEGRITGFNNEGKTVYVTVDSGKRWHKDINLIKLIRPESPITRIKVVT